MSVTSLFDASVRISTVSCMMLGLLASAACGENAAPRDGEPWQLNSEGNTANSDVEAFLERREEYLQQLSCMEAFDCREESNLPYPARRFETRAACLDDEPRDQLWRRQDVPERVERGRLAYNPAKAEQCLQALQTAFEETQCDWNGSSAPTSGGLEGLGSVRPELPTPCGEVLDGKLESGDVCYEAGLGRECADDLVCDTSATEEACSGRCRPIEFVGEGETCADKRLRCEPNSDLSCESGTCRQAQQRSEGERCTRSQCGDGLLCTREEGSRRCRAVEFVERGDSCSQTRRCRAGLTCDRDTTTCQPLPSRGESCSGIGSCRPSLVCIIEDGERSGTCQQPLIEGESCRPFKCDEGLSCFPGRSDPQGGEDNVCTPLENLTERCELPDEG